MKKILSTCLLTLAITSTVWAQQIALTAGVNFAKISTHGGGINFNSTALTSFHAGLILDEPLADQIHLQARLLLSGEGGKYADDIDHAAFKPYYLKLPLNLIYQLDMPQGKLFAGLGPYASLGIFGNYNENGSDTKLRFGNNPDDDLKSTDFGANFLAGYELDNGLFFSANYSLGLTDIAPANNSNYKTKNMLFGISLGYFFRSRHAY